MVDTSHVWDRRATDERQVRIPDLDENQTRFGEQPPARDGSIAEAAEVRSDVEGEWPTVAGMLPECPWARQRPIA
jgi:hypothetical protein